MSKFVPIGVFLLSLTALPGQYIRNNVSTLKEQPNAGIALFASLLAVIVCSVILFNRFFRTVEPMMYVYSLFCWTSVCALGFVLQIDGFLKIKLTTVLLKKKPYLKSAYGALFLYWDGIVHLTLCLAIIVQYIRRKSHRELSLVWCGSMINSGLVLVFGQFCNTGSQSMTWMGLFAWGYVIFPVNAAVYYLHNKPVQARAFIQFPSIWRRPIDCFFMLFFKAAGAVALFRCLAVLGGNLPIMKDYLSTVEPYINDPSVFPKFQIIVYGFLYVVYYTFAIYGLRCPGQHWMADWSLLHAGAAAQAQFCHIGGALHRLSSKAMTPPMSGLPAVQFWTVNLLLTVMPLLFAYWCQRDPEKNGRSYNSQLAQPIETKIVRSKVVLKSD